MKISELLKSKGDAVFTASPHETLQGAAAMLHARRVGAMVVTDQERVVGILSERDIVRLVAQTGASCMTAPVSQFMSKDVVFATPQETVDQLLARMTDRRIRHLPVMSGDRLVGILSIGDLVKAKIASAEAEAQHLKAYIAAG